MTSGALDIDSFRLDTVFGANYVLHPARTERWLRVKGLGEGGQGVVQLEKEEKSGKLRAVKKLFVGSSERLALDVKRELCHLVAVRDRQDLFVQILGWYENEAGDILYIAMEYFEHGDLGDYIKEFGPQAETDAKEITRQLSEGLVILHDRQICHRDLKPKNVLIASYSPIRVKLADFGISKSTSGTTPRTRIGTHGFLAPEIHGFPPPKSTRGNEYTNAVDLWALGCLVHQILTSRIPFTLVELESTSQESGILIPSSRTKRLDTRFNMTHFAAFCDGADFPSEDLQNSQVSRSGVDFVMRLLVVDPESRMSAAEALNHPWLN